MKTAIYVRVSTNKTSQKDSPEHQRMLSLEMANTLGLEVSEDLFYEDRDSGTSIIQRPSIQRMLRDAIEKKYEVIIFASLSRFSRDMLDSLTLKRKLVDSLKIRLISIEESYDSLIDRDEFKFQIMSAVNQKISEQISQSSKRGIRQSALKGNFTGSIPPYGYKKTNINDTKTLVIVEYESSVVKRIFDLYTFHRHGEKRIVEILNNEGIESPKGGLWGITSIQRILQNEAYTGIITFSKYETIKVHDIENALNRTKKLIQRHKDLWERPHGGNTHEAIITNEQFERAQKVRLLRGGGSRGGVRNVKNAFAGIVKCPNCNSSMLLEGKYLICSKRRRQGKLGCNFIYKIEYQNILNLALNVISESKLEIDEIENNPSSQRVLFIELLKVEIELDGSVEIKLINIE